MEIIKQLVYYLAATVGGVIGLVAAVMLLLGLALSFVLLLQTAGFLRRVPFGYNLRNLVVRWPTTLLTGLAFTLVVGLFTVMLAFVNGMNRLTENSGQAANVMVLSDGAIDEAFSSLGFGDITTIDHWPTVQKDENGEPLTSWEVYIIVNQPIPNAPPGGRQRRFLQMRGLKDPARTGRVHNIDLHPGGSWFSDTGIQPIPGSPTGEQAIEVVLGEGIARELGQDKKKRSLEVGDIFPIAERQWVVVGILNSSGSTFDSEIWAKQQLAGEKFGKASFSTVVLRTADAETARQTVLDLSDHFKSPAVLAQVETEYYEKLTSNNRLFLGAAWFIAAFMVLGGVFGIMNAMFAAISQRQKDIGVMRILGYALADPPVVLPRIAAPYPDGRHARLPAGNAGRRLEHDEHHHEWTGRRQERRAQADRRCASVDVRSAILAGDGQHRRTVAGSVGDARSAAGIGALAVPQCPAKLTCSSGSPLFIRWRKSPLTRRSSRCTSASELPAGKSRPPRM